MIEAPERSAQEWLARAWGRGPDGVKLRRGGSGNARNAPDIRMASSMVDAAHADDNWAWLVQIESAWLSIQADLEVQRRGPASLAERYLPTDIAPHLRDLFSLPSNQAQAALLGERDECGVYYSGLADLSEMEYRAIVLWLEPVEERDEQDRIMLRLREPWEIARDMATVHARRRFGRRAMHKPSSIVRYLAEAKRKLRVLFGR